MHFDLSISPIAQGKNMLTELAEGIMLWKVV